MLDEHPIYEHRQDGAIWLYCAVCGARWRAEGGFIEVRQYGCRPGRHFWRGFPLLEGVRDPAVPVADERWPLTWRGQP